LLVISPNHALSPAMLRLAELGNVMPCIGVEGFEAETDRRRGKGHFQKLLGNTQRSIASHWLSRTP
jgi:hypothetical protein